MLKYVPSMLCLCFCLIGGIVPVCGQATKEQDARRAIEDALGFSKVGVDIVKLFLSQAGTAPNVLDLRSRLQSSGDMKNLSVGILFLVEDEDLQITYLGKGLDVTRLKRILEQNETDQGSTFVRIQDVTSISVERSSGDKIIGCFSWSIPEILKGTCHFILGSHGLEYLGIPRKKSTHIYDGFTIFSEYGDFFASHESIRTVYFVALKALGKNSEGLPLHEQQRDLTTLLNSMKLENPSIFGIAEEGSETSVIYSPYKQDQEKLVSEFEISDQWSIVLAGRAISTPLNSLGVEIKKQLRGHRGQVFTFHKPDGDRSE